MVPAALGLIARSGAAFGGAEAAAARASLAARGGAFRRAMGAAGGNRQLAQEMIVQKAGDLREQQRMQRQMMMEQAREEARISRANAGQQGAAGSGGNPNIAGIHAGTNIVANNFRQAAMNAAPEPIAKLIQALGGLTDAIESRAHALAPYSAPLTAAVTGARVRQLRADIYEANVAGDSMAKVVDAMSKLQTGLQEGFAPVKDELAKMVEPMIEGLRILVEDSGIFKIIRDTLIALRVTQNEIANAMADAWDAEFTQAIAVVKEIPKLIDDAIDEANKPKDAIPDLFLLWWKDPLLALPAEPGGPPAGGDGLDIPLLEGL